MASAIARPKKNPKKKNVAEDFLISRNNIAFQTFIATTSSGSENLLFPIESDP